MASIDKIAKFIEKGNGKKLAKIAVGSNKEDALKAIEALGKVGGDEASNALMKLIMNPDKNIRIASAKAMGEMGNPHLKAHLQNLMRVDKDQDVIDAVMDALKNYHNVE